jgi:hypothetical protein
MSSIESNGVSNVLPGKNVLYNIVGFARESVSAHVTTLLPDNFPSDRKEPWLVDFFTPVGNYFSFCYQGMHKRPICFQLMTVEGTDQEGETGC